MIALYKTLGYSGALPFILCALGLLAFHGGLGTALLTVQLTYAGLILSFLGGVHWVHAFPRNSEGQMLLAIAPSLLALFVNSLAFLSLFSGWFSPALQTLICTFALVVYIFGFIFMYGTDLQSLDKEEFPDDYMDFRLKVTILVCGALGVSAMAIWV